MNHPPSFGRRSFLKKAAVLTGSAALLPSALLADPYAPLAPVAAAARPVRVQGLVHAGGQGLAGVAVTDGVNVVQTGSDGTYTLYSTTQRPFVYVSLPSGYAIPQHETGTANFYRRIEPDPAGEAQAVFGLQPRRTSDDRHAFFLLADPQTEDEYEVRRYHEETVPDVAATSRLLGEIPKFGIGCGDLMFDNLELFPEYERAVDMMGVPFFQVVGNHDIIFDARTSEGSIRTFQEHFGPDYYSFNVGDVHYVVLNDVFWHGAGYIGYLTGEQLAWLASDLALVEPGRTVVVALHIPALMTQFRRRGEGRPSITGTVTNREALYRLLEPYDAHLLSGHTHENEHVFEGGVHEHVHGTVCGAWWSGPICFDGTPNGYGVYEVSGSELRWHYKSTGYDEDHQIRAYSHGADPGAPDEIVANVWGWDPEWNVVWYEDGERRGAMARRVGLDPLSVELHQGPNQPPRRTWVNPMLTEHLFYAPASRDTREILVEATDRFGRVYTQRIPVGA